MPKKKPKKRAPGAGRKSLYGEPLKSVALHLPQSVVDLLDSMPGSRSEAARVILIGSVQYRLEYGSGEPLHLE